MTSSQTTRRPTVLVTGASQGIGAGIAVEMARQGYDVAVTSMRPEKLAPVLEAIRAGRPPELDGHEGRKAVAIVEACYRSARTSRIAVVK
jgi:NAD(P)-dependent dehydrogenase (short-subunit alcohol dehydrogenase family)